MKVFDVNKSIKLNIYNANQMMFNSHGDKHEFTEPRGHQYITTAMQNKYKLIQLTNLLIKFLNYIFNS